MHFLPTSRRDFLRKASFGVAGLLIADSLLADPYQPVPLRKVAGKPVRISGVVKSGKKGLAGIAISDGRNVAMTQADGSYSLVSDTHQPFVFMSMPAGYEIPKNPSGTARFYEPISASSETLQANWTLTPLPHSDLNHGFLSVADPQTLDLDDIRRYQNESAADAKAFLATQGDRPFFKVAVGDIMFDHLELYPEYEKAVSAIGVPAFQVVGNHDLNFGGSDEGSVKTFQQHFGPNYYSFNRGQVHYVVLDDVFYFSNGYMGYLDQTQLDWLAADLAMVPKGSTVVVFAHIPVYHEQHIRDKKGSAENSMVMANRQMLYRSLEGYKAHIIGGHTHFSERLSDGGVSIHVTGAACGAWWTGDICYDGTPNGYGIYEVNGSDFTSNYKSTGHLIDHQMRVYRPGSDLFAPDELVANVWDADDSWQIFWYEDGMRKGKMAKRVGLDPLSVQLHSGDNLPPRSPWVDPQFTNHLYYAPVSATAKEIRVEAIAPDGKVFSEVLG